jgi:hypothetical protein
MVGWRWILFFAILRHMCYIILVPKKTKQEKIIADLRRKLDGAPVQKLEVGSLKMDHEDGKWTSGNQRLEYRPLVSNVKLQNPTSTIQLPTSAIYIKKDLLKTLILSMLAVSFELVLYSSWH